MLQCPGPLYKPTNGWLSSLKQCYFSFWKADILLIHARFSPRISVCDWERKMKLNVTLSKNLPNHDSHCFNVLYSIAHLAGWDVGGVLLLFSHSNTTPYLWPYKVIERQIQLMRRYACVVFAGIAKIMQLKCSASKEGHICCSYLPWATWSETCTKSSLGLVLSLPVCHVY